MSFFSFLQFRKTATPNTFFALSSLQKTILNSLDFNEVVKKSVNTVLDELGYLKFGYRIIVLALVDGQTQTLRRIAISQTEEATKALAITPVPFKDIVIPLSELENLSIKALNSKTVLSTNEWYDILRPVYTPEEAVSVQKAIGIKSSMVYPIFTRGRPLGILIFSMVKDVSEVTEEEKTLIGGFTDLVGIAVQNSLLYTSVEKTTQQLKYANTRLKELDKLKDDFVSIASHELRTPMTAIRSYAWMALNRSDVPLSEKLKKYIGRTLISTERLINLVNDMLNISRIESGRVEITPQPFDLSLLVTDVLAEVDVKAKEKSLHMQHTNANIPRAFADPDKVHQVLLNLVGNAIKFTPENGLITIFFFSDGLNVEASVKDSGVGITKEDQSKLFTKFGRLDNSYVAAATSGGTGLGLYICKNLIELMGGKIWASSEGPGKGTVFTFSLPVANSKTVSEAAKYTNRVEGGAKMLEPVTVQSVT